MGDRVRVKLRGGTYLEGEFEEPLPYKVTLRLLAGTTHVIDYSQILGIEVTTP